MPMAFWTTLSGLGGAVVTAALFYIYGPRLWDSFAVEKQLAKSKDPSVEKPKPMTPLMRCLLAFAGIVIGGGLGYWVAWLVTAYPANARAAHAEQKVRDVEDQLAAARTTTECLERQVAVEKSLAEAEIKFTSMSSSRDELLSPAVLAAIDKLPTDPQLTGLPVALVARVRLVRARTALMQHEPQRALDYVRQYITSAATLDLDEQWLCKLRTVIADALRDAGQYSDAHAQYDLVRQMQPSNLAILLDDGFCLSQLQIASLAIERLQMVERQYLNMAPQEQLLPYNNCVRMHAKITLSAVLMESDNPDPTTALSILDSVLAIEPSQPEALTNRANVMRCLHRWDDARIAFGQSVSRAPAFFQARWNYGVFAAENNDYQLAIEQFQKCCELEPSRADAHYQLGTVLLDAEKPQDALKWLSRAVELGYPGPKGRCQRGIAFVRCHNLDEARIDLEATVHDYPAFATGYVWLARCIAEQGNVSELQRLTATMSSTWPRDSTVRAGIARAFARAHRYEEAVCEYEVAVSLSAADAPMFCDMGIAQLKCGQVQQALISLTLAIGLDAQLAIAVAARADAYEQLGDLQSALVDREYDVELRPMQDDSIIAFAQTLTDSGNRAQAADAWGVLVQLREARRDSDPGYSQDADVAAAKCDWASALEKEGRAEQAVAQCECAGSLLEHIPAVAMQGEWYRYLANIYQTHARALINLGRISDADVIMTRSVDMLLQARSCLGGRAEQLLKRATVYREHCRRMLNGRSDANRATDGTGS